MIEPVIHSFDFGSLKSRYTNSTSDEIVSRYSLFDKANNLITDAKHSELSANFKFTYSPESTGLISSSIKYFSSDVSNVILVKNTDLTDKIVEDIGQILFEQNALERLYFLPSSVASIISVGEKDGVVLDSGHMRTRIDSVLNGFSLSNLHQSANLGGFHVNEGIKLNGKQSNNAIYLDNLKRQVFFLNSFDKVFEEDQILENLVLPDGTKIQVGATKYEVPEVLLNPANFRVHEVGLQTMIDNHIIKVKKCCEGKLGATVVLSGGNVLFKGLQRKLRLNMQEQVTFVDSVEADLNAIKGAAILARLSTVERLWVTSKDYEEFGRDALLFKNL